MSKDSKPPDEPEQLTIEWGIEVAIAKSVARALAPLPCPDCHGVGYQPTPTTARHCYACNGTGEWPEPTVLHV